MKNNNRLCVSNEILNKRNKILNEDKIGSSIFEKGNTKLGILEFGLNYAYSDKILNSIQMQLKKLLISITKKIDKQEVKILLIGVGNSKFTADNFGVYVSNNISSKLMTYFQNKKKKIRLYYFNPDIRAKTGLDTIKMINVAIENITPDLVFLFDCYATRQNSRIGKVIQIKNRPLAPASAVKEYDEKIVSKNDAEIISIGATLIKVSNNSDILAMKTNADLLTNRLGDCVSNAVSEFIEEL